MLERMLIGDTPWVFLLEVMGRTAIVYVLLLVCMRFMGKRVPAQLGAGELAVVLMLGAAIGAPIQVPLQGILPGVIVLAGTMGLQRGLAHLRARRCAASPGTPGRSADDPVMVVHEGRLLLPPMARCRITHAMLASELRAVGVQQLGELRRVYFEANGRLSLIRYRQARPGLSLMPQEHGEVSAPPKVGTAQACWYCGYVRQTDAGPGACTHCGVDRWEAAVQRLQAA